MDIIKNIGTGKYKNIIILTGAGISTNAGFPDYVSSPENVEDIHSTIREKIQDNDIKPTLTHQLCVKLHELGYLKRIYTQNIDGLHIKAGLPENMVVDFHGNVCGNITGFGDKIDNKVLNMVKKDFLDEDVDLLLIMGTSLQIAPFCALPNLPHKNCPRILVDKCPQNVYTNSWSKPMKNKNTGSVTNDRVNGLESHIFKVKSQWKIGKRITTLRPKWLQHSTETYIFEMDTDKFSSQVLNSLC